MGQLNNSRTTPRVAKAGALNLLPFMNLVTLLIPLLLIASQFVELAIIDSTVPGIISAVPPAPSPDERLMLRLKIGAEGITVEGADRALAREGHGPPVVLCHAPCRDPESYNLPALGQMLAKVKDAWPDDRAVTLQPEARIPFDVLVAVMDTTREHNGRELFPQVRFGG